MRSVMGSLKRSPKFPCPRDAKVWVRRRPATGIIVFYDDVMVGEFTAGLLVGDQVIVELKVAGR
jgi:hypothetical protein